MNKEHSRASGLMNRRIITTFLGLNFYFKIYNFLSKLKSVFRSWDSVASSVHGQSELDLQPESEHVHTVGVCLCQQQQQ